MNALSRSTTWLLNGLAESKAKREAVECLGCGHDAEWQK